MTDNLLKDFITSTLDSEIGCLSKECLKSIQDLFNFNNTSTDKSLIEIQGIKFVGSEASDVYIQFNDLYFDILFNHIWSCYSADKVEPIVPTLLSTAIKNGPSLQLLFLLTKCLKTADSHIKKDLAMHLSKCYFIYRNGIKDLLVELSKMNNSLVNREDCIRCLLSFPSHYCNIGSANKNNVEDSILQDNDCFINTIIKTTLSTFARKNQLMESEFETLSCTIGMIAFLGYSDLVFRFYSTIVNTSTEVNQSCVSNYKRVLIEIPDKYFDSLITVFFLKSKSCMFINNCIGNLLMNCKLINLLRKLLFMRYYSGTTVLTNILGYISICSPPILLEFSISLVKVWSNSSSIRLTDYDQQFYISKALTISFALLDESSIKAIESETLIEILPGISAHLESPIESIRYLGMVVGEFVTNKLNTNNNADLLKFDYSQTEDVVELIKLRTFDWSISENSDDCVSEQFSDVLFITEDKEEDTGVNTTERESSSNDLDSDDDDFEAMPMAHDLPLTRGKQPRYVRECMEGLLVTSNSKPHELDTFEACMNEAESLIYQHESSAKEVAVEFSRIVLHLTAHSYVENFDEKRKNIACALCIVSPREVAKYLIEEFFQPHYSISQRLDILTILSMSAQKLSNKSININQPALGHQSLTSTSSDKCEEQSWKQIIEARIEAKTRRFASASKRPMEQTNCFIPYAGDFFFGLMESYDRKTDQTLDLLGRDYMVLSKLIYSLGVIFQSSANAPSLQKMTNAFLNFLWVLRWHSEPSVRRAVLFSLCSCFITAPNHFLFPILSEEMTEWKYWLETDCEKDSDVECRELSSFALIALRDKFESSVKNLVYPST